MKIFTEYRLDPSETRQLMKEFKTDAVSAVKAWVKRKEFEKDGAKKVIKLGHLFVKLQHINKNDKPAADKPKADPKPKAKDKSKAKAKSHKREAAPDLSKLPDTDKPKE